MSRIERADVDILESTVLEWDNILWGWMDGEINEGQMASIFEALDS